MSETPKNEAKLSSTEEALRRSREALRRSEQAMGRAREDAPRVLQPTQAPAEDSSDGAVPGVISRNKEYIIMFVFFVAAISAAVGAMIKSKDKPDRGEKPTESPVSDTVKEDAKSDLKSELREAIIKLEEDPGIIRLRKLAGEEVSGEGVGLLKSRLESITAQLQERLHSGNLLLMQKDVDKIKCNMPNGVHKAKPLNPRPINSPSGKDSYLIEKVPGDGLDGVFRELESLCHMNKAGYLCTRGKSLRTKLEGVNLGEVFAMKIDNSLYGMGHFDEWQIDLVRGSGGEKVKSVRFTPIIAQHKMSCDKDWHKGKMLNVRGAGKSVDVDGLSVEVDDSELVELIQKMISLNEKNQRKIEAKKEHPKKMTPDEAKTVESKDFYGKVQKGTVILSLNRKNKSGGLTSCTGFIYDEHTIVTAGHCLDDFKSVFEIKQLVPGDDLSRPGFSTVVGGWGNIANGGGGYESRYVDNKTNDFGFIRFKDPVFAKEDALKISDNTLGSEPLYLIRYGKSGRSKWRLDRFVPKSYSGSTSRGMIEMDICATRKGNSGGPIVNAQGEVVSVVMGDSTHHKTKKCKNSRGHWITKENIKWLLGKLKKSK